MSYINKNLTTNEKVEHVGKVSLWSLLPYFLLGLFLLAFQGLGLIFWAIAAIKYFTTELVITNKRIIAKFGLIRRDTIEINIGRVESIQVKQGILGRIFDFGSLVISGAGNPQAPVPSISEPLKFRSKFFAIQEAFSQPVHSHQISKEEKADPKSIKKCPDCAEDVKRDAKKCRHCGFIFDHNLDLPGA